MSTQQENALDGNIGHYRRYWGKEKWVIFDFESVVELLLGADAGDEPNRFKFDREIALLLLLIWTIWPGDEANQKTACRLIADAITFHRCDQAGVISDRRIKKLASLRKRLEEPWYKTFYERFYAHFGGLASARLMRTPSTLDDLIRERQSELNTSLDLIEFLLRRSKVNSRLATRDLGTDFIASDGFQRYGSYCLQSGEKTSRKEGLAVSTVSKRWDAAPATVGLAYIIRQSLPDLWAIKMTDRGVLPWLVAYAADRTRLKTVFSQYHWLANHLPQVTQIEKCALWPTVDDFAQESFEIPPFSEAEQAKIASIRPGGASTA